jgi:hypothetical protein
LLGCWPSAGTVSTAMRTWFKMFIWTRALENRCLEVITVREYMKCTALPHCKEQCEAPTVVRNIQAKQIIGKSFLNLENVSFYKRHLLYGYRLLFILHIACFIKSDNLWSIWSIWISLQLILHPTLCCTPVCFIPFLI